MLDPHAGRNFLRRTILRKIRKNSKIFYDPNNVDDVPIKAEMGFLDFAK